MRVMSPSQSHAVYVVFVDVAGDGHADLVFLNHAQIHLRQARRDVHLAYVFFLELCPHLLRLALNYMNGDGKADAIWECE